MTSEVTEDRPPMLQGKCVLVTGAGGGIGREIALLAAREGASVVVNDLGADVGGGGRDSAPARETVALIRAAGGRALAHFGDVSDAIAAQEMVDAAVAEFGRLDAVVNNAGNFKVSALDAIRLEDFDAVLRVHLYGSFIVSRAAAPVFIRQGSGVFLHTTSSSGLIGSVGALAYATAKGAIASMSRSIALDMARHGVRSNCIAPSAASRMSSASAKKGPSRAGMDKSSAHQMAPPAVFLISDAAAGFNGQVIGVRGNEVFLYNQPRPVRSLHAGDGWTAQALAERLPLTWKSALVPLESFTDVFAGPPV